MIWGNNQGGSKITDIIFSDLDSTFLDKDTYSSGENGQFVKQLIRKGVIVVFATSKTFQETLEYLLQVSVNIPFITENGGALFLPLGFPESLQNPPEESESAYEKVVFGIPIEESLKVLKKFLKENSLKADILHQIPLEKVVELTGLPKDMASKAQKRDFDLTFTLSSNQSEILESLQEKLRGRKLRLQKGGRFLHITGETNKAIAARQFLKIIARRGTEKSRVISVGDSENDFELLQMADIPIVIPNKRGELNETLRKNLGRAILAHSPAPDGWMESIKPLFRMED